MIWVWVVVCVLVIGAVAVVVAGRDDEMAEVYDDRPDVPIPTGRALTATDLDQLRFSTGLRGYRMDEVDAFVARVKAELLAHPLGEREDQDDERYDAAADEPDEPDEQPRPGEDQPDAEQPEGEQPEGEQPEGEQPEAEQPETEQPETEQPEGDHEPQHRSGA